MIVCLLQELVFSKVKSYVLNRYTSICEYCSIDHVCLYELRNVSSTMSTFMKPNNKSVNILMFYFWLRTVILASTRVYCLRKATMSSFHRNILSVFLWSLPCTCIVQYNQLLCMAVNYTWTQYYFNIQMKQISFVSRTVSISQSMVEKM